MLSRTFTIKNEDGLHLRPAAILTKEMGKFKSQVSIKYGNNDINAKSLINIVGCCIKYGSDIIFEANGEDEEAAMAKFEELLNRGFTQ